MAQLIRTAKQLGSALSNERLRQGLTQESLSKRTGIGQKTISQIEAGKEGAKLAALGLELQVAARSKASEKKIDEIF